MINSNRKPSLIVFFIIGLIVSFLIGIIETQFFFDKTQEYRNNHLWKSTVLFYALTISYTLWIYFLENYMPIFKNLLKFVFANFLLALPYFFVLILTSYVSIKAVLTVLPGQIVLLTTAFIWHVALEFNPDLDKRITTISIIAFIIGAMAAFVLGILGLPQSIALFLSCFAILGYLLFLLIRSQNNIPIKKENNKKNKYQSEEG